MVSLSRSHVLGLALLMATLFSCASAFPDSRTDGLANPNAGLNARKVLASGGNRLRKTISSRNLAAQGMNADDASSAEPNPLEIDDIPSNEFWGEDIICRGEMNCFPPRPPPPPHKDHHHSGPPGLGQKYHPYRSPSQAPTPEHHRHHGEPSRPPTPGHHYHHGEPAHAPTPNNHDLLILEAGEIEPDSHSCHDLEEVEPGRHHCSGKPAPAPTPGHHHRHGEPAQAPTSDYDVDSHLEAEGSEPESHRCHDLEEIEQGRHHCRDKPAQAVTPDDVGASFG